MDIKIKLSHTELSTLCTLIREMQVSGDDFFGYAPHFAMFKQITMKLIQKLLKKLIGQSEKHTMKLECGDAAAMYILLGSSNPHDTQEKILVIRLINEINKVYNFSN